MKCLILNNKCRYSTAFITPRNLCIWDIRRKTHKKYVDIAKQFGISRSRTQQIYERMQRAYEKGVFHYEDIN